jgi:hypothetical protein
MTVEGLTSWSPGLIAAIGSIGSAVALFALLARLRIEQLSGRLELGFEAANAVWNLLPGSIARSRSLLVAKDALVVALDYFMSWQPFADSRLWEMSEANGSNSRWRAVLECDRAWKLDLAIPEPIKLGRKSRVEELLPCNAYPGTWWGNFFADVHQPDLFVGS